MVVIMSLVCFCFTFVVVVDPSIGYYCSNELCISRLNIAQTSFMHLSAVNCLYAAAVLGARFRGADSCLLADANGNLDPEAPPANYGRRRSRAVLYQLSGHYKQDKIKTKLKLNNVSIFIRVSKVSQGTSSKYHFKDYFSITFTFCTICNTINNQHDTKLYINWAGFLT